MGHVHHAFDYIELAVTDVADAKAFFGAALGWTFSDYGPDYAGIVVGDREAGGLAGGAAPREPSSTPPSPLVVLYAADLDATLAAVTAAGGTIVTPTYDFPGGRRFHFACPSGNHLAVWGPTTTPGTAKATTT